VKTFAVRRARATVLRRWVLAAFDHPIRLGNPSEPTPDGRSVPRRAVADWRPPNVDAMIRP